ncbi:MAG: T9SS type A sorting domain-containing protein [Chitinophagaceae bacterium]
MFPNPVAGRKMMLQFSNMQTGTYQLDVFRNNGEKVYSRKVNHPGGSSSETLELPPTIASGLYYLIIKSNTRFFSYSLLLK